MKHLRSILLSFAMLCLPKMVVAQMQPVDLGLSVKWASCNLGASSPEEYGEYFAWGEIEAKEEYSVDTYRWGESWSKNLPEFKRLIKYNREPSYGKVDNKTSLEESDDAAHVRLGGKWRLPKSKEIQELISTKDNDRYCWEWKSVNGHNGWMITYLENNSSIFLPAAGAWFEREHHMIDSCGCYWSSYLNKDSRDAMFGGFVPDDVFRDHMPRVCGLSVRPVME